VCERSKRPCGAGRLRGLCALALLWAAGCGDAGGPPSLLLITLDTTRADRIGAYGHASAQTPVIDGLARQGILFEQALAPAPTTLPSHTSILTGLYPVGHGVQSNALFVLEPQARLVSEALREQGWRTAAFVAALPLVARLGLSQGFEVYSDVGASDYLEGGGTRPADAVVSDALEWLGGLAPGERFFVWLHLWEPHGPHEPPPGWQGRAADAYDAEIAYCDQQIGRLLGFLRERGLDRELVTIVTADHGEGLGEHGEETHGTFLYQSTLRVPLVMAGGPLARSAGTRVAENVSTAALAPTLLALAGLAPEVLLPAVRLAPLVGADGRPQPPPAEAPVYLETQAPYYEHRLRALDGVVSGRWKLVQSQPPQLYALDERPSEERDLARSEPEQLAALQRQLAELRERQAGPGWASSHEVGAGEGELLEALGYAVSAGDGDPYDASLPAARVEDVLRQQQALAHRSRARSIRQIPPGATPEQIAERERQAGLELDAAKALVEEILASNPEDPQAMLHLGYVEFERGDFAAAAVWLERAAAARPSLAPTHLRLAQAYAHLGRWPEAVVQAHQALTLQPDFPTPYGWLAERYAAAGEYGRAVWWYQRLLERLEPGTALHAEIGVALRRAEVEMQARGQQATPPEENPLASSR